MTHSDGIYNVVIRDSNMIALREHTGDWLSVSKLMRDVIEPGVTTVFCIVADALECPNGVLTRVSVSRYVELRVIK